MVKVRLLVPTCDNAGQPFPEEAHEVFERYALEQFGGYTNEGMTLGAWLDDGKLYRDTCRAYSFAVPSILDTARLRAFAVFAANHYRQEAMYIEVAGIPEVFKPNWRELTWKHVRNASISPVEALRALSNRPEVRS